MPLLRIARVLGKEWCTHRQRGTAKQYTSASRNGATAQRRKCFAASRNWRPRTPYMQSNRRRISTTPFRDHQGNCAALTCHLLTCCWSSAPPSPSVLALPVLYSKCGDSYCCCNEETPVGPVCAVYRCGETMPDVSKRALSATLGILALCMSARQQAYCMRCGSTTATGSRGSSQHRGEQRHHRLTPTQSSVRSMRPGGATAWVVGPGIAREAAAGAAAAPAPFAGGALRMMAESGAPPAKKGKGKGPYKVIATNK